jgi:hypothetical protein
MRWPQTATADGLARDRDWWLVVAASTASVAAGGLGASRRPTEYMIAGERRGRALINEKEESRGQRSAHPTHPTCHLHVVGRKSRYVISAAAAAVPADLRIYRYDTTYRYVLYVLSTIYTCCRSALSHSVVRRSVICQWCSVLCALCSVLCTLYTTSHTHIACRCLQVRDGSCLLPPAWLGWRDAQDRPRTRDAHLALVSRSHSQLPDDHPDDRWSSRWAHRLHVCCRTC